MALKCGSCGANWCLHERRIEAGECAVTVYLDSSNILWRGKRWCHLYADSLDELLAFGDRVGLRRSWLQHPEGERGLPHYDVTGSVLARCVAEGAVRVDAGDGTYRRLRQALTRGEYPMERV